MTVTGVCAREGVGWWWVLGGGYHVQRGVVFALARVASWKMVVLTFSDSGTSTSSSSAAEDMCSVVCVFRGVCSAVLSPRNSVIREVNPPAAYSSRSGVYLLVGSSWRRGGWGGSNRSDLIGSDLYIHNWGPAGINCGSNLRWA